MKHEQLQGRLDDSLAKVEVIFEHLFLVGDVCQQILYVTLSHLQLPRQRSIFKFVLELLDGFHVDPHELVQDYLVLLAPHLREASADHRDLIKDIVPDQLQLHEEA